ncbi:peptide chain release factor 2 [soil metagenome]
MDNLKQNLTELEALVNEAMSKLSIADTKAKIDVIEADMASPDFWNDPGTAQDTAKKKAKLEHKALPWVRLRAELNDIREMTNMDDTELEKELSKQLKKVSETFESLKDQLKLSGPYDDADVIMSIHAGAGGTDAQDWAEMLLRMYVRWAEKHDVSVTMIDESSGDEAGIKSVTLELSGNFLYGKLKGEHGTHRLVRLSPFNSDNLRQTSFAKADIMPKIDEPKDIEIDEKNLRIDVYRSSGKGGQSVNTTDSAVRITHIPTNIVVAIQNERSQLQNRETAMTILRSRLAQLRIEQHAEKLEDIKGPNKSAEWGNQIRSYVLHPYKQVKDLRTRHESSDPDAVLSGELDEFIDAYLEYLIGRSET